MWLLVPHYRQEIEHVAKVLGDDSVPLEYRLFVASPLWNGLVSMGHTFEELCREWNLPTFLAQYISYPAGPDQPSKSKSDSATIPQPAGP